MTSEHEAEFDTDVLVVGTGPTGATTALALATYGVRVQAISRFNWVANTPRAHITNQRTLEALRDLEVEEEATQSAIPWHLMGDTFFATSLAGEEIARIRTWGTGEDRHGDYVNGSPCPLLDIPQPFMEGALVTKAAARGAVLRFNTEYVSHYQDGDGVTVSLEDRVEGRRYSVRARYLVGADGARSKIVEDLGLPLEGEIGRAAHLYTHFRADLSRFTAHRPSTLQWMMTPSTAVGEIGMGLLRAIRPWDEWIAGWGYHVEDGEPDVDMDVVTTRIRELIGDPEQDIEILSCGPWFVNEAYVEQYSVGRVFCGGDAVHRHPPSSGLGSNTSIQDGFNLAWKLAYVIKGWSAPELLDSYTLERSPVGKQVVARANQSRADYAPLHECFRTSGTGDPVAAGMAKLNDPSPAGAEVRTALTKALDIKQYEFNAQGVELNQRYVSAGVIPDEGAGPELWDRDPQLYLKATTRPGAKLPHAWLVGSDGRRVSTLDIVGKGRFTLLTGLCGGAWVAAARALGSPFVDVRIIGEDVKDPYRSWDKVSETHEAGAVLVRPDGYVAWRQRHAQWDEGEALDTLADVFRIMLGA